MNVWTAEAFICQIGTSYIDRSFENISVEYFLGTNPTSEIVVREDQGTPAGRLIAAAEAAKIEAIIQAGRTPPVINKGGRPKGIPNKVTPTVATMILKMKADKRKAAVIARRLNLSRQTVYEVLRRA